MSDVASQSQPSPQSDDEAIDLVRRRLLQEGGRYLAPAVVASLLLERQAYGQSATSCAPQRNRCTPLRRCAPGGCPPAFSCNPGACAPVTGS